MKLRNGNPGRRSRTDIRDAGQERRSGMQVKNGDQERRLKMEIRDAGQGWRSGKEVGTDVRKEIRA